MNERKIPKESEFQKSHTITSSQDLKGSSSQSNFYVSKIMKQNKIKNESLINESLPNLKKSIQNIFSNEDEKEKIFQFLIKKNKDRSANVSKEMKNNLKTPENRSFRNFELKKIKSPSYYDYYPSNANNNNKDMTKSCNNLGGNNNTKETHTKIIYNYSGISGLYPEDDTLNQNKKNNVNNFYHNTNNNTFTNLLSNNNIVNVNGNRNKAKNKVEHIAIYNTYNNTFNSFRMQKNKDDKNDNNNNNKSLDNKKNYYYFRRSFNNKENNSLEKNPYKDYMKNSNLFGMKKKISENYTKKSVIDISDSDKKKDENSHNKKILYLKRDKNDIIRVQKNDNLAAKKNSISINNSFINNNKRNYYIHKNLRYKKIIPKKVITPDDSNTNINAEVNNNNNNENNENNDNNGDNKVYEKRRNYFDIYGNKDIRVNTLESIKKSPMNIKNNEKMNKTVDNDIDLKSTKLKIIKVNIDKNINKKFLNSPLSIRFNKYPTNNNYNSINTNPNINTNLISSISNKKIYEKREPFQRSPKQRFNKNLHLNNNNTNNDIFNKNKRLSNAENNNNNIINNNIYNNNYNMIRNKLVFNNEEEIIEFIKKKYNKRNVDEIFNRNNNNNHHYDNKVVNDEESNTDRGRRYGNVMTTEEGNKIKLKNEELSSEITQLKNDNKKYKKELIDMKTKYNDLNKQMNTIKEKDNNNKY